LIGLEEGVIMSLGKRLEGKVCIITGAATGIGKPQLNSSLGRVHTSS